MALLLYETNSALKVYSTSNSLRLNRSSKRSYNFVAYLTESLCGYLNTPVINFNFQFNGNFSSSGGFFFYSKRETYG